MTSDVKNPINLSTRNDKHPIITGLLIHNSISENNVYLIYNLYQE